MTWSGIFMFIFSSLIGLLIVSLSLILYYSANIDSSFIRSNPDLINNLLIITFILFILNFMAWWLNDPDYPMYKDSYSVFPLTQDFLKRKAIWEQLNDAVSNKSN